MQILIAHGRVDVLARLIDLGVNLLDFLHLNPIGPSGGLRQLLQENVLYYLAIQQLLHHGWNCHSIADAMHNGKFYECDKCEPLIPPEWEPFDKKRCAHQGSAAANVQFVVAEALIDLHEPYESVYRSDAEANWLCVGWQRGTQGLSVLAGHEGHPAPTTDADLHTFCDNVLLPQAAATCAALRYNAQRFGGPPGIDCSVGRSGVLPEDCVWRHLFESAVADVLSCAFHLDVGNRRETIEA